MKKITISLILWSLTFGVVVALAYDVFLRQQTFEQTILLVEQSNEELRSFFDMYQEDKNRIGYFKTNWKNTTADSLKKLQSMEYAYEKSQSLRERIDAFGQEMIGSPIDISKKSKKIFLSQNAQNLLKDSLQSYHYAIIAQECKDCSLGSDAYSDAELDLWKLETTLPLIWNTALLSLEAKTWLLQHRVIDYHSKKYLTKEVIDFPYNDAKIYVKSEFRVVEEGKIYNAKVFFGMNMPMMYNYLSMKTDFQKVMINNQGEGQILFTTWTSSYNKTGEYYKTWEGDIYLVKDFILLDNSFQFEDTTLNIEDDYMLIRENY